MEIHQSRAIGELLAEFIHGSALEQPLLEIKPGRPGWAWLEALQDRPLI